MQANDYMLIIIELQKLSRIYMEYTDFMQTIKFGKKSAVVLIEVLS